MSKPIKWSLLQFLYSIDKYCSLFTYQQDCKAVCEYDYELLPDLCYIGIIIENLHEKANEWANLTNDKIP